MVGLDWCKKQARGISLIDRKGHLSESYLNESKNAFDAYLKNDGNWKVITGYYACYNSLYAILVRVGIKSEIHDCTIELMELIDLGDDYEFMKQLKDKRTNVQYYLQSVESSDEEVILKFIEKCRMVFEDMNSAKIEQLRGELKK